LSNERRIQTLLTRYYPLPKIFHLHQETFISDGTDERISQNFELGLMVYSATSLAKDDNLSSSNVVGKLYSSISPINHYRRKIRKKNKTRNSSY
jgi:hypothetical protein